MKRLELFFARKQFSKRYDYVFTFLRQRYLMVPTMTALEPETIRKYKNPDKPLVCLTAYTTPMATILDPHCDIILVGDSVGMVLYGMDNTNSVTLDMMIAHGRAVAKGCKQACLVVDLPYGTYENGPEQAVETAQKIHRETQCQAVKLEGGVDMAPMIQAIVEAGIPVMGHIGLQPQQAVKEGGFRIKGKTRHDIDRLMADAAAVEAAGVFAFVIEGTIASVSENITNSVSVPTIGIGACVHCDGQILVTDDMLSLTPGQPKFVRKYTDLKTIVTQAVKDYARDVQNRDFPNDNEIYAKR